MKTKKSFQGIEMRHMEKGIPLPEFGKIFPLRTMFFRESVGDGTGEDGNKYELSINMGGRHPIVHSKQSGKWFTLNWTDIVILARKAGIDKMEDKNV